MGLYVTGLAGYEGVYTFVNKKKRHYWKARSGNSFIYVVQKRWKIGPKRGPSSGEGVYSTETGRGEAEPPGEATWMHTTGDRNSVDVTIECNSTWYPSAYPTEQPSEEPSEQPTIQPTDHPTENPTEEPTEQPTE